MRWPIVCLVVITTGTSACRRVTPTEPACLALIATADVHGALFPQELETTSGTLRRGGLLAASAYLSILRQHHGERLLLVDAGDLLHGTLIASLTRGHAVIDAFNALRYDAAAIGNHEFDYGPRGPDDPNPTGVLEDRLRQAQFPFLAANVFLRTGQRPAWPNVAPSLLREVGGLRVGLIGVTTVETPRVTKPQNVAHLEFRDPVPIIIAEATRLRADGAKLIILLAHMGGACSDNDDGASCDPEAELFRTLAALPPGTIDAAVGGHQHTRVAHWVHGVPTLEPSASAKQLGWLELCAKPSGGIDARRSRLHPLIELCLDEWVDGGCADRPTPAAARPATFLGQPLTIAAPVEKTLADYAQLMRREYEAPLGVHLPLPLAIGGSPPLEELICRATAEVSGAPIVLHNRGGVRADLPAGPLRFGQVFEVLPFSNQVAVMRLSGAQLESFARLLFARRGQAPFTHGLRVTAGQPVTVELADGTPLLPQATYRVATNDYLAYGGEGANEAIGTLSANELEILDQTLLDAFVALLRREFPAR